MDRAWELGVRYFDTAPHYGLGLSEHRLGAALAHRPRSEFLVPTKVGRWLAPSSTAGTDLPIGGYEVPATLRRVWDFTADGVKRLLEASLERLGLDHVDIVYLHDPDDHWEAAIGQAHPALADLRDQGKVSQIGVGMNQWEMPAAFVRETDLDLVMLAGRYTLLEQPALAELLPLCVERGVSVIAAAVLNTGLMSRPEVGDDDRSRPNAGGGLQSARRGSAPGGDSVPARPPRRVRSRRRCADSRADDQERRLDAGSGARRTLG